MTKPYTEHDKLATRLSHILIKLNQGEKLDPEQLAQEFNVSLRTIQRDLTERFSYLPLKKDQNQFFLEPYYLGKLSRHDIERFASLAGVTTLFPSLNSDFLRELFDSHIQQAYLIKSPHREDLSQKNATFKQLEQAIIACHSISFQYKTKSYQNIEPYKMINDKGIWYLAGKDQNLLKAFCFTAIEQLQISDSQFTHQAEFEAQIQEEDGIWFGQKTEVVLKVNAHVAHYFKRRSLIPNQHIDKQLEDGGLIISARITHNEQILPLIRYWLPNVHVISPNTLRDTLLTGLHDYLNGDEHTK